MGQGTVYDSASRTELGLSQQQLRALNEGLARDFGAALSGLLRTAADVSLRGVDQTTYGQFAYNAEEFACFYVLKAEPWDERLMLDIEPAILHPMIDRMLGGAAGDEPPSRPLTEIELCLAARIVRVFLREFQSAWHKVAELKLSVLQVESNPRLLRILPADELVILFGFEVALGDRRGMMRLCLPCRAIARLDERLLLDGPAGINRSPASPATVNVTLAKTQISVGELADLCVGDIIATETSAESPAIVSIDGAARFRAKPGAYQGRKAVRLTEALADSRNGETTEEGGKS